MTAPFTTADIEANRRFFADKLRAERGFNDAVSKVKGTSSGDFLLVDTRGRDAYAKAHIPGALCVPLPEIDALAGKLPRDKELVTYCWNAT
jgi:rhodanese-related sulfurtransferase